MKIAPDSERRLVNPVQVLRRNHPLGLNFLFQALVLSTEQAGRVMMSSLVELGYHFCDELVKIMITLFKET